MTVEEKFEKMFIELEKKHFTIHYNSDDHSDWSEDHKLHRVSDINDYEKDILEYTHNGCHWLIDAGTSEGTENIFDISLEEQVLNIHSKILPMNCYTVKRLINTIYLIIENEMIEKDLETFKMSLEIDDEFKRIIYRYFKCIKGSVTTDTITDGYCYFKRYTNGRINSGFEFEGNHAEWAYR